MNRTVKSMDDLLKLEQEGTLSKKFWSPTNKRLDELRNSYDEPSDYILALSDKINEGYGFGEKSNDSVFSDYEQALIGLNQEQIKELSSLMETLYLAFFDQKAGGNFIVPDKNAARLQRNMISQYKMNNSGKNPAKTPQTGPGKEILGKLDSFGRKDSGEKTHWRKQLDKDVDRARKKACSSLADYKPYFPNTVQGFLDHLCPDNQDEGKTQKQEHMRTEDERQRIRENLGPAPEGHHWVVPRDPSREPYKRRNPSKKEKTKHLNTSQPNTSDILPRESGEKEEEKMAEEIGTTYNQDTAKNLSNAFQGINRAIAETDDHEKEKFLSNAISITRSYYTGDARNNMKRLISDVSPQSINDAFVYLTGGQLSIGPNKAGATGIKSPCIDIRQSQPYQRIEDIDSLADIEDEEERLRQAQEYLQDIKVLAIGTGDRTLNGMIPQIPNKEELEEEFNLEDLIEQHGREQAQIAIGTGCCDPEIAENEYITETSIKYLLNPELEEQDRERFVLQRMNEVSREAIGNIAENGGAIRDEIYDHYNDQYEAYTQALEEEDFESIPETGAEYLQSLGRFEGARQQLEEQARALAQRQA